MKESGDEKVGSNLPLVKRSGIFEQAEELEDEIDSDISRSD